MVAPSQRPVHSINAVSVFWHHVAQIEHWKSWAEFVHEAKAVLNEKPVRAALLAARGKEPHQGQGANCEKGAAT
jgi:hypothetical protein